MWFPSKFQQDFLADIDQIIFKWGTTEVAKSHFEKEDEGGGHPITQLQGCSRNPETVRGLQRNRPTENGAEQGTGERTRKDTPNLFLMKLQKQFHRGKLVF